MTQLLVQKKKLNAFRRNAQRIDRSSILDHFGWSADKPIVAVYACNWFDYHKAFELTRFRDFHDWIMATHAVAMENKAVN